MFRLRLLACLCALAVAANPPAAAAWGRAGHMLVSRIGTETLPDAVPAFLRTKQAVDEITLLGPEADNLKGSGRSVDKDEDPGHYVDIGDDGRIMGAVMLAALPPDREAYDTALRAVNSDQYKAGFLPYSLIDGFEIIRKDLAYWRVDDFGARTAASPGDRAYFANLRALRETLTLRDIGYWSHFVADGSQPLHDTIHYDGWEERYPGSKGLHAKFESNYVNDFVKYEAVKSRVKPFAPCACTIEQAVPAYLAGSAAQVVPLYELFKSGAFAGGTEAGVNFTADRLAYGATALRNMIVEAWLDSANQTVGYPPKKVRDIESGQIPLTQRIFGTD